MVVVLVGYTVLLGERRVLEDNLPEVVNSSEDKVLQNYTEHRMVTVVLVEDYTLVDYMDMEHIQEMVVLLDKDLVVLALELLAKLGLEIVHLPGACTRIGQLVEVL